LSLSNRTGIRIGIRTTIGEPDMAIDQADLLDHRPGEDQT